MQITVWRKATEGRKTTSSTFSANEEIFSIKSRYLFQIESQNNCTDKAYSKCKDMHGEVPLYVNLDIDHQQYNREVYNVRRQKMVDLSSSDDTKNTGMVVANSVPSIVPKCAKILKKNSFNKFGSTEGL